MRNTKLPLAFFLLTLPLAACSAPYGGEEEEEQLGVAELEIEVCPGNTTIEGIDVSKWQANTDWTKVKGAGIKFAFIKATESDSTPNMQFAQDWAGAKANGIVRGAYHFFRTSADAVAQADYFVNTMGTLNETDLPGVLDLETNDDNLSASELASRALAFLERVEERTGKRPIIYSGYYFWKPYVQKLAEFKKYSLWIPRYVNPGSTSCPLIDEATWTNFAFWQYSSMGSVNGVSGNVDRNIFNGSLADLKAFASGSAAAPLPSQVTGNDAITVVNWPQDKRAEVFVTTKGGDLLHTYTQGGTDTWQPLATLDGGATCGISAGFWPAPKSRAEVFSPKSDGTTQHIKFDGTMWTAFQDFGGKGLSHLSTLAWPDGHLEVFARGEDSAVWHSLSTDGTSWAAWESLGGTAATGVSPIVWGDGHAELLMTDAEGTPWLNFSGDFEGGWFGWLKLEGKLSSRPVPVRWPDGHIELFARGADGYLHHATFGGTKWGPFTPIEKATLIEGEPSVIMNSDKDGGVAGPEVFARNASGVVMHLGWDGSGYTDFEPLLEQVSASDPFGWIRADDRAEVFAIDHKGALVKSYREDTGWTAWASLGGDDINPCIPGSDTGAGGGGGGGGAGAGTGTGTGTGSGTGGAGVGGGDSGGDEIGCACRTGAPGSASGSAPTSLASAALAALLLLRKRRDRRR